MWIELIFWFFILKDVTQFRLRKTWEEIVILLSSYSIAIGMGFARVSKLKKERMNEMSRKCVSDSEKHTIRFVDRLRETKRKRERDRQTDRIKLERKRDWETEFRQEWELSSERESNFINTCPS